jgi:hypothetical protein
VGGAFAAGLLGAGSLRAAAQGESGIAVFPRHGTATAMPGTEISFRGESTASLGTVEVIGSASGGHSGILSAHSDGLGVSYLPDSPFLPGEAVTVRADVPLDGSVRGAVTFRVGVPGVPASTPTQREIEQPSHEPQQFRSRPDLLPPSVTITDSSPNLAPGYVVIGAKVTDGQNGAMIVDNRGEVVWFNPLPLDIATQSDVRVQTYRGEAVITAWEGVSQLGTGFGHLVIYDQSYGEVLRRQVPNGYPGADQHEFLITARDTALVIIYNPLEWDLTSVGGPANGNALDSVIQEIDLVTKHVVFEWHSLDHIAPAESYTVYAPEEPWDYVHFNSVELDEDDNFIVSARNSHAIYKIERESGRIRWRLHGKRSDFRMGPDAGFALQHDARLHPDGTLSLFDNHEGNQALEAEAQSRGMVLRLDEDLREATLVREYVHPTEILSVSQGNMQTLPNGNVFVGWGSAPVFSEFSSDGQFLFNGRFPQGTNSYRAFRYEWEGQPGEPPAVAVEAGLGDMLTIFVSWNGDTRTTAWRVLAGESADDLDPIGTVMRSGFETEITVQSAASLVVLAAQDADGNELIRTDLIPVTTV